MKDYYKILNISKKASIEEIKKSYRKLAQIYHPDKKSGSNELFHDINEAYQVLSDPNKKILYDISYHKKRINFNDIFKKFNFKSKKNTNYKINLDIDIKESVQKKIVKITKTTKCSACEGYGGKKVGVCPSCNGNGNSGYYSLKSNGGVKFSCLNCSGRGYILENICRECNGKQSKLDVEKYEVEIKIKKIGD